MGCGFCGQIITLFGDPVWGRRKGCPARAKGLCFGQGRDLRGAQKVASPLSRDPFWRTILGCRETWCFDHKIWRSGPLRGAQAFLWTPLKRPACHAADTSYLGEPWETRASDQLALMFFWGRGGERLTQLTYIPKTGGSINEIAQ